MTEVAERSASKPPNALSVRPFRMLWFNNITFFMAMNALRFVYGWVVLDGLERSESVQGLAVFMLGLPMLLLVLPAGHWADRFNRKGILISTQIATAAVMAGTAIAIAADVANLGVIIASALLAGAATAVGSPVRGSLLPELLPKDLLFSGIAVNALAMTASLVAGALLAQVIGDAFGFDGTFWYLCILLLIGLIAAIRIEAPPVAPGAEERESMWLAVREGISFVLADRALSVLFLLLGLAGFVMNALMFVTLQPFIKEELGRDAGDAAPVLAMMGLGLATTSFIVMRQGNMAKKGVLFMRAMLVGTAMLSLIGRATEYWHLFAIAYILGCAGGFFINMNQGLIQANTPNELMGRVMGLFTLVQAGLTPLGALVFGIIAGAVGAGITITVASGVAFVIVLILYFTATELREMT